MPQQLIDIAVSDLIATDLVVTNGCAVKYSSLQDFYKKNPHCCDIDFAHTYLGAPANNTELAGIGYLVGGIRMYHYCNAPKQGLGKYAMGFADITSCGILIDPTVMPYESKFVGRYPR